VVLAWLPLLAAAAVAQEDRPQITPPQSKPGERKIGGKEVGPRALALLQLGANGKASLVPIAILVNGKFWDAAAYKAAPVPMALDSGTVYEVEKTGSSQGLFTVGAALHSNSANVPNPWIGTGLWLPAGSEGPKTAMKAEAVPVGLETSDGPPRLAKSASPPKETPTASSAPAGAPSGGSTSAPPSTTAPSSSGTSTGSASTGTGSAAPASAPPSTPAGPKPADAKPSESKSADAKPAESKPPEANVPASDSGAGGSSRPRLRRGKPTEPLPEDDIPGYSKPGAAPAVDGKSAPAESTTAVAVAAAGPVQLIPAISDTSGPEPRSYTYEWLKGEESDRLKQMTDLAKAELRVYIAARAKAKINTPAQAAEAARSKRAGKPPEPVLENVQMTAYDLWTNGQPVMVFSADAHVPPPGATNGVAGSDVQYSIMLVAHPDMYNNLSKLYVGITDQFHLDITQRLDLIDVVDADGDGRGELLFRETSDAGSGYVIYRVTADKLWKMFDSLNAE
jgi:hypothetical protein